MLYENFDGLIGGTPLLEMKNIERKYGLQAKLFAKLEFLNPTGSAKDRAALFILNEAEKSGKIGCGATIIEATSGNTGIGLASIGTSRGYKVIIVMPDTMSAERIKLIKSYGAEIVLTPGSEGMKGSIEEAKRLNSEIDGSIIAGQFDNPANTKAHYEMTGPEIYSDLDGKVDIFVAGIGTGGTISGTGKYLKEQNVNTQVIGVEPDDSPLLSRGYAGTHGIQGIGANFVPSILDMTVIDKIMTVSTQDAFNTGREIGKTEGILVGISSGAAMFCAVQLASKEENKGKNIVVLLPDSGDRYLSTAMFGDEI